MAQNVKRFVPIHGDRAFSKVCLFGCHGIRLSWQLERRGGIKWYLDTADENKCNWMMFVRPASSFEEQNLVAYQHGEEIFFVTTRTIEPKEELKVWRKNTAVFRF